MYFPFACQEWLKSEQLIHVKASFPAIAQIPRFQGETEHSLRGEVFILSTTRGEKKPWARPPIMMQFTVSVRAER